MTRFVLTIAITSAISIGIFAISSFYGKRTMLPCVGWKSVPGATHWQYGASNLIVFNATKRSINVALLGRSRGFTNNSFNITTGSLILSMVTLHDEGTYLCVQYNRKGLNPILIYTTMLTVQVPPVLSTHPSGKVNVNTSGIYKFACFYSRARPAPTSLEWRNGSVIVTSRKLLAVKNAIETKTYHGNVVSRIAIREHYHNQVLICAMVWNLKTITTSITLKVQVMAVVSVRQQNPDTNLAEGGTIVLVCTLHKEGRPAPTISWTTDSNIIKANSNITFSRDTMSLRIKNLKRTDNGDYRCHGRNSAGVSDSNAITVDIDYQPRNVMIQEAPSLTSNEGTSLVLTCSWTAKPVGSATWKIWSAPIDTSLSKYHIKTTLKSRKCTMGIDPLVISDNGVYTCAVRNGILGSVESNQITLDIRYCPRAGRLSVSQGNTTPLVNKDNVTIKCSPNKKLPGNPDPHTYRWLRNGQLVNRTNSDVWILSPTTARDGGSIQCGLKNGIDCLNDNVRYSNAVKISVQGPPTPSGKRTPNALSLGENITLSCGKQSNPVSTYVWRRNGLPQNSLGRILINDAELTITNMTNEYGIYKCIASNKYGSIEVQFNVTQRGPPEQIIELGQVQANLTSFSTTLYWTPGFDGGYPQTFSLE